LRPSGATRESFGDRIGKYSVRQRAIERGRDFRSRTGLPG
jgi:hypothetical protein